MKAGMSERTELIVDNGTPIPPEPARYGWVEHLQMERRRDRHTDAR